MHHYSTERCLDCSGELKRKKESKGLNEVSKINKQINKAISRSTQEANMMECHPNSNRPAFSPTKAELSK